MRYETGYFDRGFKPDICNRIGEKFEPILELWQMPRYGTPVPAERLVKVAMWFGKRQSYRSELPVIVAATPPEEQIINEVTQWYYGLADAKEASSKKDSQELAIYLTDKASFRVSTPSDAFNSLQSMLPESGFDFKAPLIELPEEIIPRPEYL